MVNIGQRVRIHPACDWFMRGAVYGIVTSKRPNFAYVKLELGPIKLRAKIAYNNLAAIGEDWPND